MNNPGERFHSVKTWPKEALMETCNGFHVLVTPGNKMVLIEIGIPYKECVTYLST